MWGVDGRAPSFEEAFRAEYPGVVRVVAPIVGSVCMDMIMLDVTGFGVQTGDEVVLIGSQGGEQITAREVAATIGTIPWEIVCRLGSRIVRAYA